MLIPIFVGHTKDGDQVILYSEDRLDKANYHLRRPDGELWALGPKTYLRVFYGVGHDIHMAVQSPAWTGLAKGTHELAWTVDTISN